MKRPNRRIVRSETCEIAQSGPPCTKAPLKVQAGGRHSCSLSLRAVAFIALVAMTSLAAPMPSWAGTGGTEFNSAYTTITDWLQGDLGRLIAASLLVVGLVMGVVRQSIMAAVPAIACGLVATVAPTIISAVVTATL
jgi:conjugal transfer pilus assembly protein TraA